MDDDFQLDLGSDPSTEGGDTDSLADGFLKDIPEADRAIVEKYVRDWDGNVTKKFQSIHEQYRPYKEIGADPDILRASYGLVMALQDNPKEILQQLQESLAEFMNDETDDQPVGGQLSGLPEYEGLPPSVVEKMQALEKQTQELAQFKAQLEQQQREAQEMAQLDKVLKEMHTKHGDFDDDYVLVQLANGLPPDKAIEKYNQLVEKVSSRQKKPAPTLLGNGSLPSGQVDASKKSGMSRKDLVASILAANQEG